MSLEVSMLITLSIVIIGVMWSEYMDYKTSLSSKESYDECHNTEH